MPEIAHHTAMTEHELQARLKSVPVPERPEDYWDDFPSRVRVQLRNRRCETRPRPAGRLHLLWGVNCAVATAVILLCLAYHPWQATSAAIAKRERAWHAELVRLDTGLRKLMLNTDGVGYLLVDAD